MRRAAGIIGLSAGLLAWLAWLIIMTVASVGAPGCGGLKVAPEPLLPPNVAEACARSIECSVFLAEQAPECIACLETVAADWNKQAREQYGDVTLELKDVPCVYITAVAHQTRLSSCVAGRWYGP